MGSHRFYDESIEKLKKKNIENSVNNSVTQTWAPLDDDDDDDDDDDGDDGDAHTHTRRRPSPIRSDFVFVFFATGGEEVTKKTI